MTPPSMSQTAPVTQPASSDSRKSIVLAISSGRPTRPIGWNAPKPDVSVSSISAGS